MPAFSRVFLGLGGAGAAYLYFKPRPKPFHIQVWACWWFYAYKAFSRPIQSNPICISKSFTTFKVEFYETCLGWAAGKACWRGECRPNYYRSSNVTYMSIIICQENTIWAQMKIDFTNRDFLLFAWELEEEVDGEPGKRKEGGRGRRKGKEKVKGCGITKKTKRRWGKKKEKTKLVGVWHKLHSKPRTPRRRWGTGSIWQGNHLTSGGNTFFVNIKLWCPVRIEEVKEGKIWNIAYEMENILFTDPNAMEGFKMLGVDFASDKLAHKVWFRGWSDFTWTLQVRQSAAKYGEEMARLVL